MTTCFIGLLALLLVIAGYDSAQDMTTNGEETVAEEVANEAEFTEDGQPSRPDNWREWIFVAMPVTLNTLNGRAAVLAEAQAVYIAPTSWKHWRETGTFRDGTMFAGCFHHQVLLGR